ncbi:ricin B lectin domain-containing protein, partial [Mycena capillaripes]
MRYSCLAPALSLLFTLVEAPPAHLGQLLIEPDLNNGKCLMAASNTDGAIVTIQSCTGAAAQQWTFTGGSLKIFNNTKCLDVTGGVTTNGNKLQIWTCAAGNTNQQFWYTGDLHFSWTNHGKCIDLTDGSQADGNRVNFILFRSSRAGGDLILLVVASNLGLQRA